MDRTRPRLTAEGAARSGRRSPANLTGSDLRARCEHYTSLARAQEAAGDRIEAERSYQQADHYRRMLNDVRPDQNHAPA